MKHGKMRLPFVMKTWIAASLLVLCLPLHAEDMQALLEKGQARYQVSDYQGALDYWQQGLKEAKKQNHTEVISAFIGSIGVVYDSLGDYPKALDYYQQALKIKREIGVPTTTEEGNIGDIYLSQKDFKAAHGIYSRLGQDLRLGLYHLAAGEPEKAEPFLAKGAAEAQKSRHAGTFLASHSGLGQALELLGKTTQSRGAFSQAISKIERQRELLPFTARANYFSAKDFTIPHIAAYEGRCRTAADAQDAFYWSENTKARLFIESLAHGLEGKLAQLPSELAEQEKGLAGRIASLYKQEDAAFEKKNKDRAKELVPEIAQAKKEQSGLIAKLRKDYPEYAAIQYPQPLKPAEIALNSGEVLLEYEVTDPKTLLFVLAKGKPVKSFPIPVKRDDLNKLVQTFRKPFDNPLDASGKFAGNFASQSAAELYDLLVKPALADIPRGSKLIIVPDEALALLPFEALVAAAGQKTASGRRYLGDDYDISYAQSATALTLGRTLREGKASGSGFFVLADPVFGRDDPRLKNGPRLASYAPSEYTAGVQSSVVKFMGVKGTEKEAGFRRLAQTGALAGNLERVFGKEVYLLEGKEASEARLKDENLSRHRYLVFATHGILDTDVPYIREPALVLSQIGNPEETDGFLAMSEVMGLKLNADVAALTACKTGMGRHISGEGVMGLGRAFQYAGAKNVLVSLWSVAEESTTKFTAEFFTTLKEGKTPREAIRAARAKIRAEGYEHPFYWAPFILMGE